MVGRPFLTAVAVGTGTMFALGGSTIVVSGVGIAVAKRIARAKKLKTASPCRQCAGEGYLPCDVCLRTCVVRCRAPRSMREIMLEARNAEKLGKGRKVVGRGEEDRGPGASRSASTSASPPVYCSCPACGTSGFQRCVNCLGDGRV